MQNSRSKPKPKKTASRSRSRSRKSRGKPQKIGRKLRENEFYCVNCRKSVERPTYSICVRRTKNNRSQLQSSCVRCEYLLYKFISEEKYDKMKTKYGSSCMT